MQPANSRCVCATIRMASRFVTRHYDHALAPAGLRTNDFSILARLYDEGPISLGVVASRLAMDRTTLSRETMPLIASGLVRAEADEHDGRKRLLSLTDAGRERVHEARPLWAEAQASLVETFGSERTGGLVAELRALVGAGG